MSHYETAYQLIWQKAIELYENGKTITCEELRVWLNNQLPDNFQYGLLSGSVSMLPGFVLMITAKKPWKVVAF